MSRFCCRLFLLLGLAELLLFSALDAEEPASSSGMKTLWQIGVKDQNASEFALAPNHYAEYTEDPVFIIGVSKEKKDWPYVHPGPLDVWANSRQHSFSICFALKDKPKQNCVLTIALVDAHSKSPSTLGIAVNGRSATEYQFQAGESDASISGDFAKGRASQSTFAIPADQLQAGMNEIALTTLSGSWVIYDSLSLYAPQDVELAPVDNFAVIKSEESLPVLIHKEGELHQSVKVNLFHHGSEAVAELKISGRAPIALPIRNVRDELSFSLPAVAQETPATLKVKAEGKVLAAREIIVKPVRQWVVYFLPHSHVDIGYTQLQPDVLKRQMHHLEMALELAKKSADNPPGSRFKWNTEVLWPIDNYLQLASPEKQQTMIEAIKAGQIELDAFYGNELTALCRPEELIRLVATAGHLGKRCGVKVESAMISDVPGCTWGVVPVLAAAGVECFSMGPNPSDRIGRTLVDLGDKPFYWISPSGKEKVLCWAAGTSYGSLYQGTLAQGGERPLLDYLRRLEDEKYPYDCVQVRYTVHGDNGPPDPLLADCVKQWNLKYAYPKIRIATTTEMMKDFEGRCADKLPRLRGDFTPYWEDGAASSARETAINRSAAERLAQTETLWAMFHGRHYPSDDFGAAWRNALLYDEHTWGAFNSISEPDATFVKGQWKIKQAFALDADAASKQLLAQIASPQGKLIDDQGRFQVCNTCAWPRTDLLILPKEIADTANAIHDQERQKVPAQRLSTGELAFLAKDVPALGAKWFQLEKGPPTARGDAVAQGNTLTTSELTVRLDEKSGDIKSLQKAGLEQDLVDPTIDGGLNSYRYVRGGNANEAAKSGPAKISVKESGPLVASLWVESEAPGCNRFMREIRVVSGLPRVDILNMIDKKPIRHKEGVHLGYAFHVPQGAVHMDLAWAVIQPEIDQLPGSCKNWFTVQRWVDVSNNDYGITWATIDAPLVEVGGIFGNLVGPQVNSDAWIKRHEPSQKLYSWVMNNYWYTNYRAEQEGPTPFRYSLRPHTGGYDAVAAMRFGIEQSQPLVIANPEAAEQGSLSLQGLPENVIVAGMKPSNDGKAIILRLYEVSGKDTEIKLSWKGKTAKATWLSNPYEEPVAPADGKFIVPSHGVITLRAEF